jgi:hypothetical protein
MKLNDIKPLKEFLKSEEVQEKEDFYVGIEALKPFVEEEGGVLCPEGLSREEFRKFMKERLSK